MNRTWNRAVVTGASSGIGAALVRRLGDSADEILMVGRDEERIASVCADLPAGTKGTIVVADLATEIGMTTVADLLADRGIPVDLLVNCAGYALAGPFSEINVAEHLGLLAVNVDAVVRLTHAAVRTMITAGGGSVLTVSSVGAFGPAPGNASYVAAKAFVWNFCQTLHQELRESNVTVTCVFPGPTRTGFFDRAGVDAESLESWMQEADVVAGCALSALSARDVLALTSEHGLESARQKLARTSEQLICASDGSETETDLCI